MDLSLEAMKVYKLEMSKDQLLLVMKMESMLVRRSG